MSSPVGPPDAPLDRPDREDSGSDPWALEKLALADAITRRARDFTLPALLDALAALGLRFGDIEFRSQRGQAYQRSLVHSVELSAAPRRALVYLNIGLLAAQSPLPSYITGLLADGEHDGDALIAFLGLLDHPLLRERALAEYPERDRRVFCDWDRDQTLLLHLMALQSPSSLHWLFQRIYPELAVEVGRHLQDHHLVTSQVILGSTYLGESRALGGQVKLAAGSMSVTLYCEEPSSYSGRPWAREARRRLHGFILPLLEDKNMFLDVWLIFFERDTLAHLIADRRLPDSFLGYDPLGAPVRDGSDTDRMQSDRADTAPAPSAQEHSRAPGALFDGVKERSRSADILPSNRRRAHQRVLLFRGHTDRIRL
jgi:hypothetical protein